MQNKTFRLFISSPFSDFTKERETLHQKVFPVIQKYCNDRGFSFQPIDLRWGVSNEAQLDQKTLEVCLEEVRVCKHFPYPNFLIMAGDRYGYIPLPYMIEKNEFESIEKYFKIKGSLYHVKGIQSNHAIRKLKEWYKLDKNQIYITNEKKESSAYILQARIGEYEEYSNWEKEENLLRDILQDAVQQIIIDKKEKDKYFTSATEAEVEEGILDYKGLTPAQQIQKENNNQFNEEIDKEYIFGYTRTIQNASGLYIDANKNLQIRANEFKVNLNTILESNVINSNFSSVKEYEDDKLKEYEDFIFKKLIESIDLQIKNIKLLEKDAVNNYLNEQKYYFQKYKIFTGRQQELNFLSKLLIQQDNDNFPLVPYFIFSNKGYGKTALLYHFSQQNKKCIFRSVESVLAFQEFEKLMTTIEFNNLNSNNILIIDGIEHFHDHDIQKLIDMCKAYNNELILSTNSLSQFYRFTSGKPFPIIKLEKISNDDSFDIEHYIQKYMEIDCRRLTQEQIDSIKSHFLSVGDINKFNLYLDLLKNDTQQSKILEYNLDKLIEEYKNKKLKYIESTVIEYFISYLKNIQIGLTESEILDLFNKNLYVIESIKNEFHELKENKLPISIWSKLLMSMKPFIEKRYFNGNILYSLNNDLIIKKYNSHEIECSKELYQYLKIKKNSDPRVLLESMYALMYSSQYRIIIEKLSDKNFLEEYIFNLGIESLIRIVIKIFQKITLDDIIKNYYISFNQILEKLLEIDQLSTKFLLFDTASQEDAIEFLIFWIGKSNLTDPLKIDMLVRAIENNSKNIFDYLVEKIDDINYPDKLHRIPIAMAAKVNNTYMVKRLIELGAKLEISNIANWPPILFVAENLNFELLEILIDKKIDINIKADGLTALIITAQQKDKDKVYEFAKILIEHGANVNEEEYSKIRTFEEKFDGLSLVRTMIDHSFEEKSFDEKDGFEYSKSTALDYAVINNNYKLAKLLLVNQANPNHRNYFDDTPLLLLCKNSNNVELLKLLLEYGADLSLKDKKGCNSRLYTISERNYSLMNYLFDIGEIPCQFNPNEKNNYLFAALDSDNVEYFKRLSENGVDLTQKNKEGRNLLFIAGDFNAKNCLEYLVNEIKLDINTRDNVGDSPANYLINSEELTKESMEECIKEKLNSEEKIYCTNDILETYLKLGANPNLQCNEGYTPLFWALSKDLYDTCKLLIKYGANPEIAVRSGTTPFVYAAAKCDLKYLELMIPKVKDISHKAKGGVTALMMAAKIDSMLVMQGQSHYDKVKFLLDNGANINITSDNGSTAYDYAIEPKVIDLFDEILFDGKIKLNENNVVEKLSNLDLDEIFDLYVEDYEQNRIQIESVINDTYEEIKKRLKTGNFENAKGLAQSLSNVLSLELVEYNNEFMKIYDYINELVMYDIKVSKILNYQNHNNYSIENFINYFILISESYPKNEDIWWSSYITCCINCAYYFSSLQFKESSIFAYEALNGMKKVEQDKLNTQEDYNVFNQYIEHQQNLINIVSNSTLSKNSLLDLEIVQNNRIMVSFLEDNEVLEAINLKDKNDKYKESFHSLLYIAKGLFIKYNNSDEITVSDLFNALHSVELSPQAKEVFRQVFGDSMDQLNEDTDGYELIELAKQHEKINYDEQMKELVKRLKNKFGDDLILNIRESFLPTIDIDNDEIPF